MPTRREQLMDAAFPKIREHFAAEVKSQQPWRSVFDVLGKRTVRDPTQRVHVIHVRDEPLVLNGPVCSHDAVTQTMADVLPHVRVRTVEPFTEAEIEYLAQLRDSSTWRRIEQWTQRAVRTANHALFYKLSGNLADKGVSEATLSDMAQEIEDIRGRLYGQAQGRLHGQALDILVGAGLYSHLASISGESAQSKDSTGSAQPGNEILRALRGGKCAPAVGLPDNQALVIRHGVGDVMIEVVHDLTPYWDVSDDSISLIALDEFVVVMEDKVPAYKLNVATSG